MCAQAAFDINFENNGPTVGQSDIPVLQPQSRKKGCVIEAEPSGFLPVRQLLVLELDTGVRMMVGWSDLPAIALYDVPDAACIDLDAGYEIAGLPDIEVIRDVVPGWYSPDCANDFRAGGCQDHNDSCGGQAITAKSPNIFMRPKHFLEQKTFSLVLFEAGNKTLHTLFFSALMLKLVACDINEGTGCPAVRSAHRFDEQREVRGIS
jgi:hypothetical protein